MLYPNPMFKAWCVVHKVNPGEHLHTPCTAGYQFEDDQANEVYQEEELPTTFTIDEGVALNSLVRDCDDITFDEGFAPKRKQNPRNKKCTLQALDRRRLLDRDYDEF
jgi:cytochrome c oxidase assembly protein Cox11